MDSSKNSANFELCFIFFYEHYAWVTEGGFSLDLRSAGTVLKAVTPEK